MNFIAIENAGFQSLPAEQQIEFDGVVLRFSSGYSKRANSATVMQPQNGDYAKLVQTCEQYYHSKGLPCIFRLPSFSQNQLLDDYLADNGYHFLDPTLVLYQSLEGVDFNDEELDIKRASDWIQSYCQINNSDIKHQQQHIERLNRIKDKTLFAIMSQNGKEIACGISVINNQYCGIFDVVTEKKLRNKGVGTRLLNGILNWSVANEATKSYIQVVADNLPAINLYKKTGYHYAYEYHYRIKTI